MPVRNGGEYLQAAVGSILDQTYQNLELLLVDDHSNDGAIEALNTSDERLQILQSEGDGVIDASNTGIRASGDRFVARMDADDIALPRRIETQIDYLARHREIAICGCRVEIFKDEGLGQGNERYQSWLNSVGSPEEIHRSMFIESPIPNPSAMFRPGVMTMLGGYQERGWPEDYDLFLRADAAGMKMAKPEPTLLRWRDHLGRLTRTDQRYDLSRFQAAKAHYLIQSRLRGKEIVIWGAGKTGREMFDLLDAEGANIEGFIDIHPRRIGGLKRGLPVWPMSKVNELSRQMILVAVGAAGARERIRPWLEQRGKREGVNYLFIA
jgi:glycosyltransferase involved in cell wall biosynthesis